MARELNIGHVNRKFRDLKKINIDMKDCQQIVEKSIQIMFFLWIKCG
jgi:hypothetical protein